MDVSSESDISDSESECSSETDSDNFSNGKSLIIQFLTNLVNTRQIMYEILFLTI